MIRPASPGLFSVFATALLGLAASSAAAGRMTAADVKKVAPAGGAPTIGPWKPTWCDALGADGADGFGALVRTTEGSDLWDSLPAALGHTCIDPDNPAFQAQVGAYMQRWANETGADGKQLAELFRLRADDEAWTRQGIVTCEKLVDLDEGSDRDKALRRRERAVLGCGDGTALMRPRHLQVVGTNPRADLWFLDRTAAPPSQLLAVSHLLDCFSPEPEVNVYQLAGWALCRLELPALDRGKLDAELAAAGLGDHARIIAEQALAYVQLRARQYEQAFIALTGKDPDVGKVLVDAAARGWKAWQADYEAHRAVVDAAFAYEDKYFGIRKSAAKGCLPSVQGHLALVTKGKPAASFDDVLAAASDGIGPILLAHLMTCLDADLPADEVDLSVQMVRELAQYGMMGRGPRTAALIAMSAAAAEIAADRPGFPLDATMFEVGSSPLGIADNQRMLPLSPKSGEVKTVKEKDGKVFVTFKTVAWKESERVCTPTSRILMWRPDGSPLYAESCKFTGRTLTQSSTAEPFWTYRAFAAGLRPGALVKYTTLRPEQGFPIMVYADKGGKKLTAVMGLEVK